MTQNLWLGVGCEGGTALPVLETAIKQALKSLASKEADVAGVATLDRKAREPSLVLLCQSRCWPMRLFSAAELAQVAVPKPSSIVAAGVGTPSVAEAAAILAATLTDTTPNHISRTSLAQLRLGKQVFRLSGYPGAVTVAIAESVPEYM
jgi:cobalt-precorrin 5A hydrolase/precorrin-3B C17-methyltransferase